MIQGFPPLQVEACNALIAAYDKLKTADRPRHRPPTIDAEWKRLAIIEYVARGSAKGIKTESIIAELRADFKISRAHVFAVRASLDPAVRVAIESAVIAEVELERRLTPT